MHHTLLLADPRDIYRAGLKNIFSTDPNVAHISEVTTSRDLHKQLLKASADLIIANQNLITDISQIAGRNIVIVTKKRDRNFCYKAILYGARAYFLEDASPALLRSTLYMVEGSFLLETFSLAWLIDKEITLTNTSLTDSELKAVERANLLQEHRQRQTIEPVIPRNDAGQAYQPTVFKSLQKKKKPRHLKSNTEDSDI